MDAARAETPAAFFVVIAGSADVPSAAFGSL